MKKFIGKDMTNFKDAKGRNLMETDAKILEKNKIGFNKIYFTKPKDENRQFPKITCITIFKPLNIVLGIGEYLDVIENQTKKHVLERFSQDNFNNGDKYIVILDLHDINGGEEFATVLLNSNKKDLIGKKVSDKVVDIKGNRFRKDFLDLIKEKGEGFTQYWYKKPSTNEPALKVSYVYLQKDWNWIILSGFYYEDLEEQISIMKKSILTHTNNTINKTLIWVSILCLIAIFTAIYLSFKIDNTIKEYTNKIIEHEDNKRKQQNLLIQQSKMAAMGEMLANIAHQWRQPLSAISTAATGVKLQKEINCLTDKDFDSALTSINSSAQYLSHTIDDFRNFFNPNNSKVQEFNITKTFNKILSILSAQFIAKKIEIIKNIENIKLSSIENELMQVLINILNNSRDVLEKIEDQKRLIFIDSYKNQKNLIIEIKDNAKGISEEIIDRIFEPYFTTKHKSQGTGIGLYMSKSIIEKHLNGTITVTNTTYTYENTKYKGAKFTIEIPIEKV
jgi:signal transduction histidine kinase